MIYLIAIIVAFAFWISKNTSAAHITYTLLHNEFNFTGLAVFRMYTEIHKWVPAINKQKFTPPQVTSRGSDRRDRVEAEFVHCYKYSVIIMCYQNGCYTGLPNISATVCISTKNQSRNELSTDLTVMSEGVGWTLFCLFREAIYERACTRRCINGFAQ